MLNKKINKILIGTNNNDVYKQANELLNNKSLYLKMSQAKNPYGNGDASEKILKKCLTFLRKTSDELM